MRVQEPLVWDNTTTDRLKALDNKWDRAIEFWFSRVKEGYTIKFSIEYNDYFCEVERKFAEGLQKIILE
jgi:hypothetical protein